MKESELNQILNDKRFENLTVNTIKEIEYLCSMTSSIHNMKKSCTAVDVAKEKEISSAAEFFNALTDFRKALNDDEREHFDSVNYDYSKVFLTFFLNIKCGEEKKLWNELIEKLPPNSFEDLYAYHYRKNNNISRYDNTEKSINSLYDLNDIFYYVNCETCTVYEKCVCTLKYPKEAWGKPRDAVKIRRMAWAEKEGSQKNS